MIFYNDFLKTTLPELFRPKYRPRFFDEFGRNIGDFMRPAVKIKVNLKEVARKKVVPKVFRLKNVGRT